LYLRTKRENDSNLRQHRLENFQRQVELRERVEMLSSLLDFSFHFSNPLMVQRFPKKRMSFNDCKNRFMLFLSNQFIIIEIKFEQP